MVVFPKKKNNNNNNNNNDKDSQDDDKNVEKMDFEETGAKGRGKGGQKMPLATFQKTDPNTASNPPPSNVGGGASSSSGSGSNVGVPDVPTIIPLADPEDESLTKNPSTTSVDAPADVSTSSTAPVITTTSAKAVTPASAPSTSTTSATTPAPQATTTTTIVPASSSAAASSSSSSKPTTPPTQSVIPSTAAASTNPPEKTGLGGGSGSSSQAPTINPGATFSTQPVFKTFAPKVKILFNQVKKLSEDFEVHVKKAGNTKNYTPTEKTISDNIKTYSTALGNIGKGFLDLAQSTDVGLYTDFAEKSGKDIIKLEKEIHDLETKFEVYKKLPLSKAFGYSLESATTALPETSVGGDIVIEENKVLPKTSVAPKSNIPVSSPVPATTSSKTPQSSVIFTSSSSPSSSSSILMPSVTPPNITVSPASSTVSTGQFIEALEELTTKREEVEALEKQAEIENEQYRLQQIEEEEEKEKEEEEKNAIINKKKKKYNSVLSDIDFFGSDIDQLESDVFFNRTKEFDKTDFEKKIEDSVDEIRAFFLETHNKLTNKVNLILTTTDNDKVADFYKVIENDIFEIKEEIAKSNEEIIRFKNRYWNVYDMLQGDFADKLPDKLPILDTSSINHIMQEDELVSMLNLVYYQRDHFEVSGNTSNDKMKEKEGKRILSLYEKYCVASFFQRTIFKVLARDKWSEYLNVLVGVYDDNEIDACIKALKKITTTKKSEQLEKAGKSGLKINHQYYENHIYNTKVGEDAVINYADCTLAGKGIDGFVAVNKKESKAEYIFDIMNINVENLGWDIVDVVSKVNKKFEKTDINQCVLIYEGLFGKLYVSLIKNERHECLGELLNINSQIVTKPFSIQLLSNRLFGDKYFSTDTSRMYLKSHYKNIMRDFFKRRIGHVKMEINQKDLMFFYNYFLFSFGDLNDD